MLRDAALIPSDAIRLAALGLLARRPRRYGDLSGEVRHFISRWTGPSLDLMGSSLELLRYEGLVERPGDAAGPDAELRITDAGHAELAALLQAPLAAPINDFGKLVIALKLRFLDLLPAEAQRAQIEMLIEIYQAEVLRLTDLARSTENDSGALTDWIGHEMAQAEDRLAWFRGLLARIA